MNKLPFIIPERDLNLRISVVVMILDRLSYTKRKKVNLNLDKLAIYEFLVTQPFVLHELAKNDSKLPYFTLQENEKGSVRTKYINKKSLIDYSSIKELLQILLIYQFVKIERDKNEFFYVITEEGTEFIGEVESDYLYRVRELCDVISNFPNMSSSNLKKLINPILGV
ncbi:ABC-three component system middle component 4 [Paenibacillus lautus]|uniref:ABC-three component system middle component 4 n=1 Tax=Paenibacillus lautus TaxID=1401 RepID=UPI001C11DA84|nr:ABC-three component system middle component 4 [Paenibacillus lautus]MBU5347006.1 hypothetical protein [Paenibacillus lautus]